MSQSQQAEFDRLTSKSLGDDDTVIRFQRHHNPPLQSYQLSITGKNLKSCAVEEWVAGPMLALYMALLQVWVSLQRACDWIDVNGERCEHVALACRGAMTVGAVAPVARPKCCT